VDELAISVTGAIYAAALLGGIRLFRLSPWLAVFLWLTAAYMLLPAGIVGHCRFLVPVMPILTVFAGLARAKLRISRTA
jgi:hypothetical protein